METSKFGSHDENDLPDMIVLSSRFPPQKLCPRRSIGRVLLEGTDLIDVFEYQYAVHMGKMNPRYMVSKTREKLVSCHEGHRRQ